MAMYGYVWLSPSDQAGTHWDSAKLLLTQKTFGALLSKLLTVPFTFQQGGYDNKKKKTLYHWMVFPRFNHIPFVIKEKYSLT